MVNCRVGIAKEWICISFDKVIFGREVHILYVQSS